MITLICIAMVHIGPKFDTVFLEGQIVDQTSKVYIMDFSKDATRKGFEGDYSRVFTDKTYCGPATKRIFVE